MSHLRTQLDEAERNIESLLQTLWALEQNADPKTGHRHGWALLCSSETIECFRRPGAAGTWPRLGPRFHLIGAFGYPPRPPDFYLQTLTRT